MELLRLEGVLDPQLTNPERQLLLSKLDADGECLDQIRFPHITPPWKALLDAQGVAAADGEDGDFEKLTRENAQLKLQLIKKESREKQLQTTIVGLLRDVHNLTKKVEQDATRRAQFVVVLSNESPLDISNNRGTIVRPALCGHCVYNCGT